MATNRTCDEREIADGIGEKDDDDETHYQGQDGIDAPRSLNAPEVQKHKQDNESHRPGGIRDARQHIAGGEKADRKANIAATSVPRNAMASVSPIPCINRFNCVPGLGGNMRPINSISLCTP